MTHKIFDIGINLKKKKKKFQTTKHCCAFSFGGSIYEGRSPVYGRSTRVACVCILVSVHMSLSNHFTRREKTIQ